LELEALDEVVLVDAVLPEETLPVPPDEVPAEVGAGGSIWTLPPQAARRSEGMLKARILRIMLS
jgi:hypothetical protein